MIKACRNSDVVDSIETFGYIFFDNISVYYDEFSLAYSEVKLSKHRLAFRIIFDIIRNHYDKGL